MKTHTLSSKRILAPITLINIFILILLLFSLNLYAQENDKYIMLKPLTWDELQLYQLDDIKTQEELKLIVNCPATLKNIQDNFTKTLTHMQYIHGTLYIWTEYVSGEGLICVVKHEKINSITKEQNKIINPNEYKVLNTIQARILKTASLGGGNTDKELERKKRIAEVRRINQAIQAVPYEKYGGIENLMKYMKKNTPTPSRESKVLVDRTYRTKYGSVAKKLYSPIELFESKYSKQQQSELIESVKKKEIKTELSNSVKSHMVRVPNSKIHDGNYLPTHPYGGVGRNEAVFPASIHSQGSDLLISDYVSLTAAHVVSKNDLFLGNVFADFLVSYPGAIPNGSGGYNNLFGSIIADDLVHSSTYNPSNPKVSDDYGAIRSFIPFPLAFNTRLTIDTSNPRYINAVGYPGDRVGMHEGYALAEFDDFFCSYSFNPAITFDINLSGGASGGPLFNQNETYSTGIITSFCGDTDLGGGCVI